MINLCGNWYATPIILGISIDDNIEPKLNYLQQKLLLDDKALRKLVLGSTIFHFSIEDNLKPKFDLLQGRLVLNDEELAKIITKLPFIMALSTEKNLEPTLDWLQQLLFYIIVSRTISNQS